MGAFSSSIIFNNFSKSSNAELIILGGAVLPCLMSSRTVLAAWILLRISKESSMVGNNPASSESDILPLYVS